ncbi:uncharacterized protein [Macaca nemestrina]|uniref:uncharacterized protein n=1 Tax=Macaca nemestrina TaxID=9545 RepID=UPI0039B98149
METPSSSPRWRQPPRGKGPGVRRSRSPRGPERSTRWRPGPHTGKRSPTTKASNRRLRRLAPANCEAGLPLPESSAGRGWRPSRPTPLPRGPRGLLRPGLRFLAPRAPDRPGGAFGSWRIPARGCRRAARPSVPTVGGGRAKPRLAWDFRVPATVTAEGAPLTHVGSFPGCGAPSEGRRPAASLLLRLHASALRGGHRGDLSLKSRSCHSQHRKPMTETMISPHRKPMTEMIIGRCSLEDGRVSFKHLQSVLIGELLTNLGILQASSQT